MATTKSQPTSARKSLWHHQGPVVFSPLFDWPTRLWAGFSVLTRRWLTVSRNTLFLLIAIAAYHFLLPPMSEMATLSAQWIVPLFIRNVALMLLVAGGLHVYLFVIRGQGKQTKFDPREDMEKSKKFTFGGQVRDNMFWCIASGVTIWSMYEVLYLWGAANLMIPMLDFSSHPVVFFACFLVWLLVIPLWTSTHFYFIHRLLHWPPLFHSVHKLHHRNIHIGPWSGMSMHPVEHLIYVSSVLVHFVIPSHPVIMLTHLYLRTLTPAFSHAGFQQLVVKDKIVTEAADFHHQLHHKYFECNYGNVDVPWDRWFGSVHDGSDAGTTLVQERRRRMYRNRKAMLAD
ncbi:MAG: sterol desaturase family protein [Burkholderiaceae bacterium]